MNTTDLKALLTGNKTPPIFNWDRYREYIAAMTGAEEELIQRHFRQLWDENGYGELGLSSPESQDRFEAFRTAWMLARMFTDDKFKMEAH